MPRLFAHRHAKPAHKKESRSSSRTNGAISDVISVSRHDTDALSRNASVISLEIGKARFGLSIGLADHLDRAAPSTSTSPDSSVSKKS
jgi:hypothetical protein